ncbi:Panacea domain-containing protein [Azomonas macrocytogenes]|uniref:Putative phage-associated protein n=1 Tax=Azomonas macrocytogenes TaxID=69962 RepID=A0A839T3S7_AZOMA|nr:Panacea domain-containing protein [Azomonas macrocytogenes]MBB3103748.1 putative phage-associated protein [Azomonas macrocytogenes]
MLISHDREKLIEVVKFFALNTKRLGKIKLCKLLYFLDFTHFKETGRSVTGMDYFAWKMGPVPVALYEEMESPGDEWSNQVSFESIQVRNGVMLKIDALDSFNSQHFSKRELRIMNALAEEFKDTQADDMIEATHLENLPWHQVFEVQGRRQAQIPYTMSLRAQDRELMSEAIRDREEMLAALRS